MREYKKILLAVDLTEGSEKIAERARDVAERYGAESSCCTSSNTSPSNRWARPCCRPCRSKAN